MRLREAAWALSAFCLGSAPADARELIQFGIAGGRLSDALVALAEQARITIDASDPGLRRIGSRPVRGRMSVQAALDRLLEGSGYTYRFVTPRIVRVGPVAPASPRPRPPSQPPPSLPVRVPAPSPEPPDIIVTASKQGTALDRYAGSVHLIDLTQEESARQGPRGSEWLVNRTPILSSTNLGPGRNKLFVRGIADSSFNGPSQSIVGQYLGDVRLTFNAPDPDLRLYDVQRIELLEGPQGALYGTGSLGGVLRLVPNGPDTSRFAGAVSGGMQLIRHGGQGWDAAGTVNVPLVPGQLAIRAVGYAVQEAGYIDDLRRELSDVNRASVRGGRAVLAWDAGDEWRVDIGGVAQDIAVRDGQYAMRGLPPLSRRSRLAQPFDND